MWYLRLVGYLLLGIGVLLAGWFLVPGWFHSSDTPTHGSSSEGENTPADTETLLLTDDAIRNFGLVAEPVRLQSFWRTIQLPGTVVDRPGHSDRGVVAPATGVITRILRVPGDTVQPGTPLFRLTLLNDALQSAQADLFKTAQEIKLAEAQRKRVVDAASLLPAGRLIEAENQLTRLQVMAKTLRTELLARGLSSEQIAGAEMGLFVREMTLVVPTRPGEQTDIPSYEVQELKVDLGQKVEAGQTLCLLADHYSLAVEGRAFRDELPRIEWAARKSWPIEVDLGEGFAGDRDASAAVASVMGDLTDIQGRWSAAVRLALAGSEGVFPPSQQFTIGQIGNTIDPTTRTVGFLVPLVNQGRMVERNGRPTMLWRYRPGQAARLQVPVERLDGVFVLPADAVARRGAETFVFTQNVNTFTRVPVRVLLQERGFAVLAPEGKLTPGSYVVQGAAGHLARMGESQGNNVPKGYHMHADGSLHKNGDPE